MDKNDPDAWFEHEFGPYSAVADYANAPPRGMTNPPMNRELRKDMCRDFVEYGLHLEVEDWGTGFVPKPASAPTTPQQQRQQRLARSATHSRARLTFGYKDNLRQGRVLKRGSCFSGSAPAIVGGGDGAPPVPPWHQYHPHQRTLRPIDRKGPAASPKKAPIEKERRSVHFADTQLKTLEDHLAQAEGSPQRSTFIKTPSHEQALTVGRGLSFEGSGRRPSIDGSGVMKTSKPKDPSKEGPKEEDAKKKKDEDNKQVEETELAEGMRGLRGMSQLHRAAVADRFRFGADASKGMPMVLGAATICHANPGTWSSDAAFLNKFHNSAIRIVHPSGLEVLKEPAGKKKKKKKTQEDEEDELKMSDSGLFVARYPIDGALKSLRKVKKNAFPESEIKDTSEQERQKEIAAAAAAKLKLDLGGFMLARVRDTSDEEAKELEAAMKSSGY